MTLGQRIQQLRKEHNLSQEYVGAILGVSRQAVSKWENDQTLPDTANLLAMAELFQVSTDELIGKKESSEEVPEEVSSAVPKSDSRISRTGRITGIMLMVFLLFPLLHFAFPDTPSAPPVSSGGINPAVSADAAGSVSSTPADVDGASEFTMVWFSGGVRKELTLGEQELLWPFGQEIATYSISGPHATDNPDVFRTEYLCALETTPPSFSAFTLNVQSKHLPDSTVLDTILSITTDSPVPDTRRGVRVGSPAASITSAYGDDLLYSFSLENAFCAHDSVYIYQKDGRELRFYVEQGVVSGLELRLQEQPWAADHLTVFPVVDGTIDTSRQIFPDREVRREDTEAVRDAFLALTGSTSLTDTETAQCRAQLFTALPGMSWRLYGELAAETNRATDPGLHQQQRDEVCSTLLKWLKAQENLLENELLSLQKTAGLSDLDGWLADSYSSVLAEAFFRDPIRYAALLASPGHTAESARRAVSSVAYGSDLYPDQEAAAIKTLKDASLNRQERIWADYLIAYMETPLGEGYLLPPPEDTR